LIFEVKVCVVVLDSIWHDPRVRKQIAEYQNQGIDVCCVGNKCQKYNEQEVSKIPCPVSMVMLSDEYQGKLNSVIKKIKRVLMTNKALENYIIESKPDIIHSNDLNTLVPCYHAAKKLKCKLVYDSHEICVENNTLLPYKAYKSFIKKVEKYIINRCNLMVCVSNAAAEYFEKEYKVKKPLVVTNCGLAREIYISKEKNEGFEVLNHGQFYEGRGYDIMLKAAPLLKDNADIKLALRGYGRMEEQLLKMKEELQADNVIFYPPVKIQELIPFASRSCVGVAVTEAIKLNFKLSVSNKLFEYASAGLPVIMSDIPEHRYLNEKYNFGIILKENTPECFAQAVNELYNNKELYEKYSENALKLAKEVNWENEFGKLLKAEKEMMGEK